MFRWPENVLSIVASTLDNQVHLTELCICSSDSGNSQKTLSGIPSCRNSVIKLRWCAVFDIFQCSRMEARMERSCSYWILKIPISQLWHLCLCIRIMAFTFCPGLSCSGVRVNPCVGWVNRFWNCLTVEPAAAVSQTADGQVIATDNCVHHIHVHVITSKVSLFPIMDSIWEPSNSLLFWLNPAGGVGAVDLYSH